MPVANLVGRENNGWSVAKYLLEFERGGGYATLRSERLVGLLYHIASDEGLSQPEFLHRKDTTESWCGYRGRDPCGLAWRSKLPP